MLLSFQARLKKIIPLPLAFAKNHFITNKEEVTLRLSQNNRFVTSFLLIVVILPFTLSNVPPLLSGGSSFFTYNADGYISTEGYNERECYDKRHNPKRHDTAEEAYFHIHGFL